MFPIISSHSSHLFRRLPTVVSSVVCPLLYHHGCIMSQPILIPTSRARSSTILTTSSASSTQLQTPQTPSILGVLNNDFDQSFTTAVRRKLKRSKSSIQSQVDHDDDPSRILTPTSCPFNSLPRELQLSIFHTFISTYTGSGRWEGEIGARRELFQLSRVGHHPSPLTSGIQSMAIALSRWSTMDECQPDLSLTPSVDARPSRPSRHAFY